MSTLLLYLLAWALIMYTLYALAQHFGLQRQFLLVKHHAFILWLPLVRVNRAIGRYRWRRHNAWYRAEIRRGDDPVVVTVHGTFAHAAESSGDQWWQRGSVFADRVASADGASCSSHVVIPFHWDGSNSDRSRQVASSELRHLLLELEARKRRYHVVAHSHGGNVALGAVVMMLRESFSPAHLGSLITLGTPFLEMRRRSSTRVAVFFRGFLSTALLCIFATFLAITVMRLYYGHDIGAGDLVWLFVAYLLVFVVGALPTDALDKRILGRDLWSLLGLRDAVWVVRYQSDEAIDALRLVSRLEIATVSTKAARNLIAAKLLSWSTYAAACLTGLFGWWFYEYHIVGHNLPLSNLFNAANYVLSLTVVFFVCWFLLGGVGGRIVAWLLCYPAASLANSVLSSSIRDALFGADGVRELAEVGVLPRGLSVNSVELVNPSLDGDGLRGRVDALVTAYYAGALKGYNQADLKRAAKELETEILRSIAHCAYPADARVVAFVSDVLAGRRPTIGGEGVSQ